MEADVVQQVAVVTLYSEEKMVGDVVNTGRLFCLFR